MEVGPSGDGLEWFPAPAKLNLFLHVLGRRDDGMHELQTVFRLIDRCDRVGLRMRTDAEIRFSGDFGEDNLCVRAARLLQSATGGRRGADLTLDKQLPVGGGLGGGSSDAATTLLALNARWGCGLSRGQLMALGLQLGADVPFFVFGRSALGEGVGERLRPLILPPAWYLVLVPQVAVSTKEIFTDPALTRDTIPLKISAFLPGQGHNDLQATAVRRYPGIGTHLDWLAAGSPQGRYPPRMSGSGSCVFAEYDRQADAQARLRELPAGMKGFVAQGLDHHPLLGLAR